MTAARQDKIPAGSAPEDGIPVVLVHGAAEDASLWDDVLELVAAPSVVHELPGHGRRVGPQLADVDSMGADVLARVEGPVVIAGHSMGGLVALAAALADPGRVVGLVLVASGARIRVAPALLAQARTDPPAAIRALAAYGAGGGPDEPAPAHEATYRRSLDTMGALAGTIAIDLAACDAYDARSRLSTIAVPSVVVAGADDRNTPPSLARELADGLGGELRLLAGRSHQLPWDAVGDVAAAIADVRAAAAL